jgi:hypothetical protein
MHQAWHAAELSNFSPQSGQLLANSQPHLSSAALSSKAWVNAARSGGTLSFDCRSKLMLPLLLLLLLCQGCCAAACCRLATEPQLQLGRPGNCSCTAQQYNGPAQRCPVIRPGLLCTSSSAATDLNSPKLSARFDQEAVAATQVHAALRTTQVQ